MAIKINPAFESVYSKPGNAPWTFTQIPRELKELIRTKNLLSGMRILEIGCGEGHHAIFLAKKGMRVTAIDTSTNAIRFAKVNAKRAGVKVTFKRMHYSDLPSQQLFDFIFDWRFLHEITQEDAREDYFKRIKRKLTKGGKYLSVAFSGDSDFMGKGKLRTSPVGIKIYFAKLKALRTKLAKYLVILEAKHILVPQKPNLSVLANYVLAEKK